MMPIVIEKSKLLRFYCQSSFIHVLIVSPGLTWLGMVLVP